MKLCMIEILVGDHTRRGISGGRRATETSCHLVLLLKQNVITLELRRNEIVTASNATLFN